MIMGPMHEEMSFKIDMSRRSRSRIQKFQEESEIQKIEESLRPTVHGRRSQMMACLQEYKYQCLKLEEIVSIAKLHVDKCNRGLCTAVW